LVRARGNPHGISRFNVLGLFGMGERTACASVPELPR
jgi:hypothetical protein